MIVQYDLMDVTTAYLHALADCEIFVEQPERFETKTEMID